MMDRIVIIGLHFYFIFYCKRKIFYKSHCTLIFDIRVTKVVNKSLKSKISNFGIFKTNLRT
jgi:hypothetical protein